MNLVSKIIAFESGELDDKGIINLFSELIKTGQAWTLQGCYGRMAQRLIDANYIDSKGTIIKYRQKTLEEK